MFIAAFIMGFVGSLHCAAMCGPLVLAMPVTGSSKSAILASRLVYNFGRITAYSVLGLLFGSIGKSLSLAGLQRWLSILAGVMMLVLLILGSKQVSAAGWKGAAWTKTIFRKFLQRRSYAAIFALGAANGLLPCGLVYLAGTASVATGGLVDAAMYMVLFGLGTLPMILGMGLFGPALMQQLQRFRLKSLVPVVASVIALLLILRGLALGIPYISPSVSGGNVACSACTE